MDYYEQEQDSQQGNNFLGSFLAGTAGAAAALGTQAAFGRRNALRGVRARRGQQGVVPKDVEKVREVDRRTRQSRREQTRPVTITDLSAQNFPTQKVFTDDQRARGAADTASASTGDPVNRGLANDQLGGASAEQVAPSSTQSTEQVAPSPARRAEVYKQVAEKPVSDLPEPVRPKGGVDPGRITNPDTGETFSAGRSPSTTKSVDANQLATEQISKQLDEVKSELRADRQERKLNEAVSEVKQLTENIRSREFLREQLQGRGYVVPETTAPGSGFKSFSQETNQVSRQAVEAIDTGADQQAMRVSRTVQRDPNENLAEFDTVQDSFEQRGASPVEAADAAVAVTEDTPAFTQTDRPLGTPDVKNFLIDERRKVWDAMQSDYEFDPTKYMPPTHARVEQELAKRLGPKAYKFGPKHSANRQAMEIYAMTGDPRVKAKEFGLSPVTFETLENMPDAKAKAFESASAMSTEGYPSETITPVIEKTGIKVNVPGMGEVDLADLRRPVITESTAQSAEDFRQYQIGKKKDWLAGVETDVAERYETINNIKREEILTSLDKVENILNQAIDQGNTKMANAMRARKQKLENQFENPDLYTSKDPDVYAEDNLLKARLRGARNKTQEILADTSDIKKYPTTIDWSGGTPRVFGEQDPLTGEFIPETMELRPDRPMVDTDPKGGGGRNVAEFTAGERLDEEVRAIQSGGRYRDYDEMGAAASKWQDPRTSSTKNEPGVGSTTDIYGVRPDLELRADPEKLPSEPQYTKAEIADEAMRLSSASPEGDVPFAPDYEAVIESLGSQPKTEASRRSVLMSEAMRKAAREKANRNPRGGQIPGELETLRRSMPESAAINDSSQDIDLWARSGLPPQQRTSPGVTGYGARQRQSQADKAAQQLESYMKKRMTGRSTPLTSELVIQPKLF